ncbi:MAG: hypothetical protein IPG32_10765 [Saprospirales bacterium]|nr:hypothetical protein [Saprospirales bacterium]
MYLEINHDVYLDKGPNTFGYISGLFNQSAALYNNLGIELTLSDMYIHDEENVYAGLITTDDLLAQFQANWGNYNGHLAGVLTYQLSGGLAAELGGLCTGNADDGMFVTDIFPDFLNIPAYSFSAMILTHEIGHLLGSQHTHACAWSGGQQIDDCGNVQAVANGDTPEGQACFDPANPLYPTWGTIMSYCANNVEVGTNLNLGFGPEPGNRIINYVAGHSGCASTICDNSPNLTFVENAGTLLVDGTYITISNITVSNEGEGVAAPSKLGFYISADDELSTDDYLVASLAVPSLSKDETQPFDLSVDVAAVNPGIPAGNYFVGIIVDHTDLVSEYDLDNIGYWASPKVTFSGNNLPNLSYGADNTLSVNSPNIALSAEVVNDGELDAGGSTVNLFLSQDAYLFGSQDYWIASVPVPPLSAGEVFPINLNINALAANPNIGPGSYFLILSVDGEFEVEESDESDNAFVWLGANYQVIISGGVYPNLTLYASGYSNEVSGSSIDHSITVFNSETVAAGAAKVAYYLSESFGDYDYLIGTSNIPALGPGGTVQLNFATDVSNSSIPASFYYLEFSIDYQGVIDESNEQDNNWYWLGASERVIISESPYCGSTTLLDEPSGSFSDGSGGNDYSIHTYCQWLIQPTEATESITLSFSAFDTESGYDYVQVYDGSAETATLLGSWSGSGIPGPVVSSGGSMLVRFSSDYSLNEGGFSASYTTAALSTCHDLNTFTFPEGTISDGSGEEDYLNNSDCAWLIQPDEQTGDITLSFEEFDLETGADFLRIYGGKDAAAPLLAQYTGSSLPGEVSYENDTLFLLFESNASIAAGGFMLHYTTSPPLPGATLAGSVKREDGLSVHHTSVFCSGVSSYHSYEDGKFLFDDLPAGENYVLSCKRDFKPKQGVNVMDLLLVQAHILNTIPLNSPYKIIAADVNKSSTVTGLDLANLKQLILGLINSFPNNQSWRFVPQSYVFPNPANPFSAAFPESITLTNLNANLDNQNFVAIKVGDVNLSAQMSATGELEDRYAQNLWLALEDLSSRGGKEIEIWFRASDFAGIGGMQLDLGFDPAYLEFSSFLPGQLPGMDESHLGQTFLEEGILPMVWWEPSGNPGGLNLEDGTALFGLKFNVLKPFDHLGDLLSIHSNRIQSFAAGKNGDELELGLRFSKSEGMAVSAKKLVAYPNRPDPFSASTVLPFVLPEPSTVQLRIFDSAGREWGNLFRDCPAGYQEWVIDGGLLPANGLYFYSLSTQTEIVLDKFILNR